ncbi:MAG: YajQ family cyclic di-GMP-binding protein [Candidatus Marinimicrobia bacterium]|jgi:hypothetical protein|nr:YajQ family cyclic di-GMP-binding protein [Candidatus Neomarinimicrobiota bacterium]|tara:strand:- start:386 stop:877 length:492 start_codon:yes stop_codon:yes gene_type:complete
MPSFDIENTIDIQEIDNAVNTVKRDIATRYDFKGTESTIELNKTDLKIKIQTDTEYKLQAIIDMLENRSISRKISVKTYKYNSIEKASGNSVRQNVDLQSGISKETCKKINAFIKTLKLKVNSQIIGDKLRVSAKKIDDLQNIIQMVKEQNFEIPLQFVNMKK